MHTRRVGAFLIGAWLLGTMLMWFVAGQTQVNVERILASPPPAVAKEFEDMGPDVSRQLMRFQAVQFSRHVTDTWEVVELGIGGALLATSFLTAHRSRFVIIATLGMIAMVAVMAFMLTPRMNSLGRSFDFLPATAAMTERDSFQYYLVWHRVLEILKMFLGLAVTARLLFDRYNWRDKLTPTLSREHRRRRRSAHHDTPGSESKPAPPSPAGEPPGASATNSAS